MRPTLRGVAVVVLVVACGIMAARYGARALNAIAGPSVVALLVGAIQVWRADPPEVTRGDLPAGYPGETRTVELDVDGAGFATVTDTVPAGVTAETDTTRTTLPATVRYPVGLTDRGEWSFGPVTVTVRDLLGLFQRRVTVEATGTQLVYPDVSDVRDDEPFVALLQRLTTAERQAFDSIREYVPGDPLRDVHWKSSAKRDEDGDLVVKTFTGETSEGTLTIAASASPGHADAMAATAASIALLVLDSSLSVSVVCPRDRLREGRGEDHRRRVLELLARTGHGQVDGHTWRDADVQVAAGPEGVDVRVASEQVAGSADGQANAVPDGGSVGSVPDGGSAGSVPDGGDP